MNQKITTFLMFNDQAADALEFYTSVFPNGRIVNTIPGPDGKTAGGTFELEGQRFACYNASPHPNFEPSQAISLMISADTQDEIDHYYDSLAEGGTKQPCGWVVDKFGVSWQVTPSRLMDLLASPDRETADRVMGAVLQMEKLIIADIEAAAARS